MQYCVWCVTDEDAFILCGPESWDDALWDAEVAREATAGHFVVLPSTCSIVVKPNEGGEHA